MGDKEPWRIWIKRILKPTKPILGIMMVDGRAAPIEKLYLAQGAINIQATYFVPLGFATGYYHRISVWDLGSGDIVTRHIVWADPMFEADLEVTNMAPKDSLTLTFMLREEQQMLVLA
jgi:hypothetical protein